MVALEKNPGDHQCQYASSSTLNVCENFLLRFLLASAAKKETYKNCVFALFLADKLLTLV